MKLHQYCPGGRGKLLDGIKEDGESWAAVIDKANDWVQVGTGGTCNLYSETGKSSVMTGHHDFLPALSDLDATFAIWGLILLQRRSHRVGE